MEPEYKNNVDKFFTLASEALIPSWCQNEEHWTSKVVDYLWPWNDCGCCLFFRGVTIGACIGGAAGVVFSKLIL